MKNVIGFFGGDSQVGTTMIAQSFAELLADQGLKVLLVSASGKYGDTFIKMGATHSIDDLKASIRSGKVDREELLQSLEKKKNLWILPGVRNPLLAKYFPENTIQVLLDAVREDFEYMIVDGGSDYHLGMTISALNDSDMRFFITTQQAKSLYRHALYQKQIMKPLQLTGTLIVNKYIKDPALFLRTDILRFCEAKEAFFIPYMEYGWQAEMEGTTLMAYRSFYKAIERMVLTVEPKLKKERKWKRNFV